MFKGKKETVYIITLLFCFVSIITLLLLGIFDVLDFLVIGLIQVPLTSLIMFVNYFNIRKQYKKIAYIILSIGLILVILFIVQIIIFF